MTDFNRDELFYAAERHIAELDAKRLGLDEDGNPYPPDAVPYLQEGDVQDVVEALEALGYKIVKA